MVNSSYTTGDSSPAVLSKSGHGYYSRLSLSTIYVNHVTCILYALGIYIFQNKSKMESDNGYCPYLLFIWTTLRIYYIHIYLSKKSELVSGNGNGPYLLFCDIIYRHIMYYIYIFKMSLNRNSSTVTTSVYYFMKPLHMHIIHIYIFQNESEQEIVYGYCILSLSII